MKIRALALILFSTTAFAQTEEAWKGAPDPSRFHVGALAGLGIMDSSAGFEILGTISKKIVDVGFAPDINNSVSMELQAGPLLIHSTTVFAYSTHLRWDFKKNVNWTFYAVAGLGGHITGASLGSRFLLFPRFGAGLIRHLGLNAPALRLELSHERISLGGIWGF